MVEDKYVDRLRDRRSLGRPDGQAGWGETDGRKGELMDRRKDTDGLTRQTYHAFYICKCATRVVPNSSPQPNKKSIPITEATGKHQKHFA